MLIQKESLLNTYLCTYIFFLFQPSAAHSGKYKYTSPVPCYYCPAHCASRKALQAHVKVVKIKFLHHPPSLQHLELRPKPGFPKLKSSLGIGIRAETFFFFKKKKKSVFSHFFERYNFFDFKSLKIQHRSTTII